MSEKKKCPCPRAEAQGVGSVTPGPEAQSRDRVDIDWLVEQRVHRTLAARENYNSGFWEGLMYGILIVTVAVIVLWPELKKVTAV
jgi:hypothetical protein